MLPVVKEIPYIDPVKVFQRFQDREWPCFLDSSRIQNELGIFSFIVFDPFLKITSKNGNITINGEKLIGNPFLLLQEKLFFYKAASIPNLPPFQGGALGYFSYDLLHHLEKVPHHVKDEMMFPDMSVGFYDAVIALNHLSQRAWIISQGFPEMEEDKRLVRANERCFWIVEQLEGLNSPPASQAAPFFQGGRREQGMRREIYSNFNESTYCRMVQKVIDYIHAGDIFQANVSQCFKAEMPDGILPWGIYEKLRIQNPAPFSAFLQYDDTTIASASPERFLKLQNSKVETRPIKGTRPRSSNPEEDEYLAQMLKTSEKDHAENTMIVDLLRNDLSKVCCDYTVLVKQLCGLETYATVHHLVSCVEGELKTEYDAVDLLTAAFPGGSITGAPKVRAMEIIAELEPAARGPYCGSIGYIGFDGNMDTSITIRTFVIKNNCITFQAGGGIVADSNPADEYQETLIKAAALIKILENL